MDRALILKQADELFDRILLSERNGNNSIIAATRGNNADPFKAEPVMALAEDVSERVQEAMRAARRLKPSLDRFRR